MTKFKSLALLIGLSIIFLVANYLLNYLLFFTLLLTLPNDESHLFVPGSIYGAIDLMSVASPFLTFPLCLGLCIIAYKRLQDKLNLNKLPILIVIIVSGLIISCSFTYEYINRAVIGHKIDKAEKDFDVSARIIDERIIEGTAYQYTIAINNNTSKTYDLNIEITAGRYEANNMFDSPAGDKITKQIKPGENLITGEYKLSRIWTKSTYPDSGQIPISIRLFNFDINLDKSIYVYSTLPAWKEVFFK